MQKDSGDSDLFTPVFKALSLSSALKKKKSFWVHVAFSANWEESVLM